MPSQTTIRYSEQAYMDGVPAGAAYVLARERGLPPSAASQLAEEAASEAHRRALAHDRFEDYQHFRNWLSLTARNWVKDQLRRRRGSSLLDDVARGNWLNVAETEEELRLLSEALAKLSEPDREVLRLVYLEERTLDEVADALEPNGTGSKNARRIRILKRRNLALARLREYFQV